MAVIAMTMRGSASILPRSIARLTTRYRHAAKAVSMPPRPIMHSPSASEMPVWRMRMVEPTPEDIAHPKAESRNHKPQTHHSDAGPHPGKKRSLVSENLSFDLVRVEPPLFVLSIRHLVGVVVHLSLRFATRARPCAQCRGMC